MRRIDATVAQGRCLSYGAGITYWPVVDVVAQLRPSMPDLEPAISPPLRALLDDHGAASTRRARVGVPQVRRGGRASAAARARLRRHPVGRGSTARPDRACRVRVVRRADPARLHGAAGAARPAAGLARSHAPRAAHPAGSRTDDLGPARGSPAGRRDVAAHRRGRRRQPAVRPGVGGDAGGVERRVDRDASDDPGAARGSPRPARPRRANRPRSSGRRGRGVPPGRRPGAHTRRAADGAADRACPQGVRAALPSRVRRRGRIPLPPPAAA